MAQTSAKKKSTTKSDSKQGGLQEKIEFVRINYAEKHLTKRDAVEGLKEKYPDQSDSYLRNVVYTYCAALDGFSKAEPVRKKHTIHITVKVKDPDDCETVGEALVTHAKGLDGVTDALISHLWSVSKSEVADGVFKRADKDHYTSQDRGRLIDYVVEELGVDEDEADSLVGKKGTTYVFAR